MSCDRKFKPLVLGQIQTAADIQRDAIFATGTMEITTGKRGVARITFESRSKKVWVAAGAATL